MTAEEIWYGDTASSAVMRAALTPASWLYAAGWQGYLGLYRTGIKQSKEAHPRVICVGNLTVGGMGKTPVTVYLAKLLTEFGYRVTLGCSGYGSPSAEAARLAPEGPLDPFTFGDEPALIRDALPDLPMVIGRRRPLAAQIAHENDPDGILLMDDGFQHLPVKIHMGILVDERSPKNPRCLPAGPYREPRSNASRAAIMLPDERFAIDYSEPELVGLLARPPKAHLLCGIGRPQSFVQTVESMGIEVASLTALGDHHSLQDASLFRQIDPGYPVLVTTKDWVKLRKRADVLDGRVIVDGSETVTIGRVVRSATIQPQDEFKEWFRNRTAQL